MKSALFAPLVLAMASFASAQVSITSDLPYIQNFNTLGTTVDVAVTYSWAQNSTVPGWGLYTTSKSETAVTTIIAHNGAQNTVGFYDFGTTAATDRALGALVPTSGTFYGTAIGSVGSQNAYIALALANDTGQALTGFTLDYTGEQWRSQNGTNPYPVTVAWGIGDTFADVATWNTTDAAFTFTAPKGGASAQLDGNDAANRVTGLGGTVDFDWQSGSTVWVRWEFYRIGGGNQGVAIDDVNVTAQGYVAPAPVPEPAVAALCIGVVALGAAYRRRRNRSSAVRS